MKQVRLASDIHRTNFGSRFHPPYSSCLPGSRRHHVDELGAITVLIKIVPLMACSPLVCAATHCVGMAVGMVELQSLCAGGISRGHFVVEGQLDPGTFLLCQSCIDQSDDSMLSIMATRRFPNPHHKPLLFHIFLFLWR